MPLPDLITSDYAVATLAAGGRVLTTAQSLALAGAITEASTEVRRWCGDRDFSRTTYDEIYSASHDVIELRQFPVNKVLRVSAGRSTGLTIRNTDRTGNLRASVGFTSTGDEATVITWTGLALTRTTAGVEVETDLTFAANPTLGQLAASVNALGFGWQATVTGNLAAWPSAELVGGDVGQDAFAGASLEIFGEVLTGCGLDRATGILSVGLGGRGSSGSYASPWEGYREPWESQGLGSVRVVYDAGFSVIPAPVQLATAIVVGKQLDDLARDLAVTSETAGRGSYTIDPNRSADLPAEAKSKLIRYRITRI